MAILEFLHGLDADIQQSLLKHLRDLWTHTSTAIEGNSLSLGDTRFVLEEGLTVSGKPIKDHEEVIGHAKAIDIIYGMLGRDVTQDDFFKLHESVQTERATDIYKPHGKWKVEPNGTYSHDDSGKLIFIDFARPEDVPELMTEIIDYANLANTMTLDPESAAHVYARIHIGTTSVHPFRDGNGRIARLVSNIPLLNAGLPPIVIRKEDRKEYLEILARYQIHVGRITPETSVWPDESHCREFVPFCTRSYEATRSLIDLAWKQHRTRRS